jgi:hypothetical protein
LQIIKSLSSVTQCGFNLKDSLWLSSPRKCLLPKFFYRLCSYGSYNQGDKISIEFSNLHLKWTYSFSLENQFWSGFLAGASSQNSQVTWSVFMWVSTILTNATQVKHNSKICIPILPNPVLLSQFVSLRTERQHLFLRSATKES